MIITVIKIIIVIILVIKTMASIDSYLMGLLLSRKKKLKKEKIVNKPSVKKIPTSRRWTSWFSRKCSQ